MRVNVSIRFLFYAWLLIAGGLAGAGDRLKPAAAAIASAHPLATAAGMDILAHGGNAFDAAVTVSAVLAVVEPYSSGLGGGGFWLLHRASDALDVMIDGRERAPLRAHRALYLDQQGNVIKRLSMDGVSAAAIPGEPAALVHLSEKYGRLPLSQVFAPAIRYARNGFRVDKHYIDMTRFRLRALRLSVASRAIFLNKGQLPALGDKIVQKDLADTFEHLVNQGHQGFYGGMIARQLVAAVKAAGGIWTEEDLTAYQVVERTPLVGQYRGLKITSVAPPSSGGVALITMLNMLSAYDLESMTTVQRSHVLIEVMRRAYRDRALYLGDMDQITIPLQHLLSTSHADDLRHSIQSDDASVSASFADASSLQEGRDTTHFSILDKEGNRVAATMSINYPFGSGFTVPGTGILLNDEMDDFSSKPGVPNVYGLVGAEANAIAAGKRPLSSMSPTFVEGKDGVAILGTPGGSRIISMVLLGILDFAAGHNADSWVSLPRFHHQYLPDYVQYEAAAFDDDTLVDLEMMGHQMQPLQGRYGNMQAVFWDKKAGKVSAASDPRGNGSARVE
ncbi:MAG: gamma-glutamyltransferase [Gammaproteobacteria bacterium]|nr:gamma-glutamyltransferase [Gammaproteobacteria bacterium]